MRLRIPGNLLSILFVIGLWLPPQLAHCEIDACDQLAANPYDPMKPVDIPGVTPLDKIDAKRAVPACKKAVQEKPDDARTQYQYGRSLQADGRYQAAIEAYSKAYELGSAIAAYNIGDIYLRGGSKTTIDKTKALKWIELAEKRDLLKLKDCPRKCLKTGRELQPPIPSEPLPTGDCFLTKAMFRPVRSWG